MATVRFYDYVENGHNRIREWLDTLSPADQERINSRLRHMEQLDHSLWSNKWISDYKSTELFELRIKGSVQFRPLIIDDPASADYIAAIRRATTNPPVFADLRKQFPGSASERNIAVFLEKKGFKPDAAAEAAKNFKETMALVPTESGGYNPEDEGEMPPAGAPMQTQNEQSRPTARPIPVGTELSANAPWRVVMNGDRLDIQASVDLEGLKKLQDILTAYRSMLEMLQ